MTVTTRDWCPETGEDLLVVSIEKCKANCNRYDECWAKREGVATDDDKK